ncbi:type IV pilin-like G/H family protein [Crocosphaera sp.]|uniref:type IV pilin-like G/H family protein n=1 Tax=Crocosphaera sp. TaxID=2729996 RepID=UPI0026035045|nr:type IV pilin-like G/H family protein [Crocosphaera sp.]MDJ0579231.1 type IV pilin-like G/H family protein [Crocosphaera sp.]
MNNTFKANLIKTLANKKGNKGFTLIELLVVVIIIGVLAAIALPNLLGQVGKARESEAKSTLGAMVRAQQTVFAERGGFADSIANIEVPVGNEKFYGIFVDDNTPGIMGAVGITRDPANGNIVAADVGAVANGRNGTRDYAAAINYDDVDRTFSTVVCRATNDALNQDAQYNLHGNLAATDKVINPAPVVGIGSGGVTDEVTLASCNDTAGLGQTEEVK